MNDTIVGIATAAGEGGIAIVRISGEDAAALLEKTFRPGRRKPPFESHRLMHGHVVDGDEIVDEAMAVYMAAPHTYTREDVCEIHTHGGSTAAALTMKLLIRMGARPAEAGEFTRRAFMNGRIDLSQAEAVMGVISAQSQAALRAQQQQLSGGQSRFIRQAQEELTSLLAGLEAHIDYPDEIEEEEALSGLYLGLTRLIETLTSAIDERSARIVREGLRVALCGRPNAGKSTLFNALLGEERAIVTAIPGTTRDVLEGSFTLDGCRVLLSDTAGLRDTGDEVERIGVERARRTLQEADVALMVVDASQPLTAEDKELLTTRLDCPCATLLNKQDLAQSITPEEVSSMGAPAPVISLTAKDGEGLDAVRAYLRTHLKAPQQLMLTHERHMTVAREALERLKQAQRSLTGDAPLDFAAVDLHEALYLLGRITGESVDEKLLDDIFSRFCVGK
ncbi:MAG: tRNA uridine-5-carboxymethylaminomethyl(34) synthesis GTPase MnmE [Clostridiales bacterium]|nr:tRNA uridine-5-carboxymethylaminomethyl(34) synthesis GTPase MnmE [Clostridiales bacterium]